MDPTTKENAHPDAIREPCADATSQMKESSVEDEQECIWAPILDDKDLQGDFLEDISPTQSQDANLDAIAVGILESWTTFDKQLVESLSAYSNANSMSRDTPPEDASTSTEQVEGEEAPVETGQPELLSTSESTSDQKQGEVQGITEWKECVASIPDVAAPNIFSVINPFDYGQQIQQRKPPSFVVSFRDQTSPIPLALSKPVIREDGLLLVGTEASTYTTSLPTYQHQMMATNYRTPTHLTNVAIAGEVRDLNWVNHNIVAAAVGKDIHFYHVDLHAALASCQLMAGSSIMVHSDAIREIATSRSIGPYLLTGGFDETVCVSDLRSLGGNGSNSLLIKYDAFDVVSSVRWSMTEGQLSWTTDGGDFQLADVRLRAAQIQTVLSKCWNVHLFGGLFAHEYLDPFKVALGFEMGQMLILDTRMPRLQTGHYHLLSSPLLSNGELQRSRCMPKTLAVFGMGSFAFTETNSIANLCEESRFTLPHETYVRGAFQDHNCKTSGDFSFDSDSLLGVSDK
ncbi:unnamed protein product [Albugo candida]|uniref:Uncharacterized protein n=1 Tax=Albugo candida TaxID=65357 RepID=A0A024GJG2_9STRA|nr:unnamed protein product [Albugo candida]|eukprot:CCI46449.1 unnamed protein product [Albugo candida]